MIRILGIAVIAALLFAAPVAMADGDAAKSAKSTEAKQEIKAEGQGEAVEQPGPAAHDDAAEDAEDAEHAEHAEPAEAE